MGWHINEVCNTVVINAKIAKELFEKANDGRWDFGDPVTDDDILDYGVAFKDKDGTLKLYFNSDDMEHMDYLHDAGIQKVLKKHKVKGDVCFSSSSGDNAGTSWGYRFDGKGGMVPLSGRHTFGPVNPPEPKSKAKKAKTKATTKKTKKPSKKESVGM